MGGSNDLIRGVGRPISDDDAIWDEGGWSVRQAGEYLGVCDRSVYNMIGDGTLHSSKVRGRRVVAKRSCRDLLVAGSRAE